MFKKLFNLKSKSDQEAFNRELARQLGSIFNYPSEVYVNINSKPTKKCLSHKNTCHLRIIK